MLLKLTFCKWASAFRNFSITHKINHGIGTKRLQQGAIHPDVTFAWEYPCDPSCTQTTRASSNIESFIAGTFMLCLADMVRYVPRNCFNLLAWKENVMLCFLNSDIPSISQRSLPKRHTQLKTLLLLSPSVCRQTRQLRRSTTGSLQGTKAIKFEISTQRWSQSQPSLLGWDYTPEHLSLRQLGSMMRSRQSHMYVFHSLLMLHSLTGTGFDRYTIRSGHSM